MAETQIVGVAGSISGPDECVATDNELPEKNRSQPSSGKQEVLNTVLRILCLFVCLYFFLLGLDLMAIAFKALGGKEAGKLFSFTDNPITGLMVGVLATVLVQSSSTSTSIVVGLVGADQLSVHNAIPIIMGANIGTSVTNTIVSMGHAGDRLELERAFSGATVHDMFNMLSVVVMLPVEVLVGVITGEGGPIYWISRGITDLLMGTSKTEAGFTSPTKLIVDPLAKAIIDKNKYVIKALSVGMPKSMLIPSDVQFNCSSSAAADCSNYFCLAESVQSTWAHVNEAAFDALPRCTELASSQNMSSELCGAADSCVLGADKFFTDYVQHGQILSGGILHSIGDTGGGVVGLILSLLLLCGSLFFLVKLLHSLVIGSAKRVIVKATHMNDYLAMVVGMILTIIVQSSSVVTSALTPLCGIGVLPVFKMLPLTLGANIGTTFTSILAALAVLKPASIQVALCHLIFNILGIVIWFPAPPMRRVVVNAACLLGLYASFWRSVPLIYILVAFLAIPGIALGISALFGMSLAAGIIVLLLALAAVAAFLWWWNVKGGCYRIVSQEQREARAQELQAEEADTTDTSDAHVQVQEASTSSPEANRGETAEPESDTVMV